MSKKLYKHLLYTNYNGIVQKIKTEKNELKNKKKARS